MSNKTFIEMWRVMKDRRLEIDDDAEIQFKCTICKKIMINACTAPCGCRFCLDCIEAYLRNGASICPGLSQSCQRHRIDIKTNIIKNPQINTQISRLSVGCPNIDCQSRVELSTIADHLRMCGNQHHSCECICLPCRKKRLGTNAVRNDLTMEVCADSKSIIKEMPDFRKTVDSLKTNIDKFRQDNEELKSARERIKNKAYNEVLLFSIVLAIASMGLCSVFESVLENQAQQISRLEKILQNRIEEINKIKTQVENQRIEIEKPIHQSQMTESRFPEIRLQAEDFQIDLDETHIINEATKAAITKGEISKRGEKEIVDEMSVGEFEWKIDNWMKKVRSSQNHDEEEIYSDPFLTHPNGYKIKLVVEPCEDYFALGFIILKGPFDEELHWPFNRVVELSFINQRLGRVSKTFTLDYSKIWNKEDLQKPQDGFKMFTTYFELWMTPKMLQNDRIFIKFATKPFEE